MRFTKMGILAAAVAGLLAGATGASAQSIEIVPSAPVVTPIVGGFSWVYTLVLTTGNAIAKTSPGGAANSVGGSTGSLVNFAGLGGVINTPTFSPTAAGEGSWTESTLSSPPTITGDAGSVTGSLPGTDVLFTYAGNAVTNITGSNMVLGTIEIDSTIGNPGGLLQYQARDIEETNPLSSQINTDSPNGPAFVPTPAAAWMGSSLMLGMAGIMGLRKRLKLA